MPYDPAGNYTLPPVYLATPGDTIQTQQHNTPLEDIEGALSSVLVRDGRNGMVGNLGMGGFRVRNMADGAAATDAASVGQIPALIVSSIAGAAGKTMPVDADTLPLTDSAASSALKSLTWANLKAALKTYFDTIYAAASSLGDYLAKAGGTMTGALVLNADPSANLGAATKQYVDKHPGADTSWVTFNGTGTIEIYQSYNVGSITDRGLGAYTVNFTTPMINTGYAGFADAINVSSGGIPVCRTGTRTLSGMDVNLQNQATNAGDSTFVSVSTKGGK